MPIGTMVEVRPLPVKKFHGKTGKESFSQPKVIEVLFSVSKGKYDSGLTDQEADEFGKKLGLNLTNEFKPDEAHPYYSTKAGMIKLENKTTLFDTSKPLDQIKVKNLKASKYVAHSMKAWEEGLYPEALFVIIDETEEANSKATKIELKNECIAMLPKLNLEDKAYLVQILSKKTVRKLSQSLITVEIDSIINEKPEEFMKFVKMGREEVNIRGKILECLSKNILTREAGAIYYMGEMIAMDYEEVVKWFKDPNNAKIKITILEKLEK